MILGGFIKSCSQKYLKMSMLEATQNGMIPKSSGLKFQGLIILYQHESRLCSKIDLHFCIS
jgi:hypothetical protein